MQPVRPLLLALFCSLLLLVTLAPADPVAEAAPPDESVLGEIVVTGHTTVKLTRLAVLPSFSPEYEDVIVRSVVRRDFELTGMFDLLEEKAAPPGRYGFGDPVDVPAWQRAGAEVIIKVAARKQADGRFEVLGVAYFLEVGQEPVFEKRYLVDADDVRVTAHRVTDALLGAITGTPGGFASRFTFSWKWGRNRRIFTMDADGHALAPVSDDKTTSISPTWGPGGELWFSESRKFAPFELLRLPAPGSPSVRAPLAVAGSVYSVAFDAEYGKLAVAVASPTGSDIYVGAADGTGLSKVSTTSIAIHPAWSPSGKLAWVGGDRESGQPQRVYVDGKAVSPAGFTASAPTFCDTEDGIRLVYAVAVGGERQDLVMSGETGGGIARLTQDQGSNSYPACSADGRMLAFFSTRKHEDGLYLMSLKSWRTIKVSSQFGEALRWAPLPPAAEYEARAAAPAASAPAAAPAAP